MSVIRTLTTDIGTTVTFDTVEEAEGLSAYLKKQLVDHPALKAMDEGARCIVDVMHGGIGVFDIAKTRTYAVSALNVIGVGPSPFWLVADEI